jgi:uncharacterized membrane protein YbhN (UPF0104 family)
MRPTPGAGPSEAPARRTSWGRIARIVFVLIVAFFLARTLVVEGPHLWAAMKHLDVGPVLASVAVMGLAQVALWRSWHALLSGTGTPVPRSRESALIFFVSQLGKYAPGGVWTVFAQAELGAARKVPRARGAVVGLASLIVLAVTGTALGVVALLASPQAFAAYWWTLLIPAAGVIVLSPRVLNRLVRVALRLTSPRTTAIAIDAGSILRAVAWCLTWWIAAGVHAYVLARSLSPAVRPAAVIGSFALAWVVGLLVVIAPAGVGAREGALVLLLGDAVTTSDALALGLVSRALFILGDLACAALVVGVRLHPTEDASR